MLHCAVHHGTCINAYQGVKELIASFNGAFNKCPRVFAGIVRHVICRYIYRTGVRRTKADREHPVTVQDHLRDVKAGIANGKSSVSLGLSHKLIVSILKQAFKIDQVLKIFQMLHLSYILI